MITRPGTLDELILDEVNSGVYTKFAPLKKGDTVVDAGACFGAFTVLAAQVAAKVYSFEPHPENFTLLRENTKDLKNVELYNVALGNHSGEAHMDSIFPLGNTGGGQINLHGDIQVAVKRLDEMVSRADFLKIDVEGLEMDVLEGAERLLRQEKKPRLAIEVHYSDWNLARIENYVKSFGYETFSERTFNLVNHMLWAVPLDPYRGYSLDPISRILEKYR